MRKIGEVLFVGLVGATGELVGTRGADVADQLLEIVVVIDKLGREGLKQFRVAGGIGNAHVVNGVGNPNPEKVSPYDIDHVLGEPRILLGGEPSGDRFTTGLVLDLGRSVRAEELGDGIGLGDRVGDLSATVEDDLLVRIFSRLLSDLGKKSRKAVVVIHGPAVEGMVMALGTLNSRSHEDLGHVLGALLHIVLELEVVGGRALEGPAAGGKQLIDDLVEGLVVGHLVPQPFVPEEGGLVTDLGSVVAGGADLEEFRPLHDPHLGKLLAVE